MKIDRARLFDLRVVQRNIRSGRVNKDEYAAYLSSLADTSPKIKPRDEGGDEDGYDGHPPPAEPAAEPERAATPQIAPPQIAPSPIAPVAATSEPFSPSTPPPSMPAASPATEPMAVRDDQPEPDAGG